MIGNLFPGLDGDDSLLRTLRVLHVRKKKSIRKRKKRKIELRDTYTIDDVDPSIPGAAHTVSLSVGDGSRHAVVEGDPAQVLDSLPDPGRDGTVVFAADELAFNDALDSGVGGRSAGLGL